MGQIQKVEGFHSVPKRTDDTGAHRACYNMGTDALQSGVNITRCDVEHSPATTVAFKNEWSQNPFAAIRHSDLNRETSASSFCLLYISSSLLPTGVLFCHARLLLVN